MPEHVDEVVDVPLPACCPDCGGDLRLERTEPQYQIEIPEPQVRVTRLAIAIGACEQCGRRVQGRDPRQSSDALGAAAVQLGPRAVALATYLNKELGISHEKVAAVLEQATGLEIARSTVCRAVERAGVVLEPTYDAIADTIAASPVVAPDETGWRIGGARAWLWVAVTATATLYQVAKGRGRPEVEALLGEDYAGVLCRDGWAPYEPVRRFV